jgi:hypothetical protein
VNFIARVWKVVERLENKAPPLVFSTTPAPLLFEGFQDFVNPKKRPKKRPKNALNTL